MCGSDEENCYSRSSPLQVVLQAKSPTHPTTEYCIVSHFRLAGSLPEEVLARMAEERRLLERSLKTSGRGSKTQLGQLARRHFATLESWLDKAAVGPTWLAGLARRQRCCRSFALSRRQEIPTGRLFIHAEPCQFCLRTFSAKQRSGVSLIHHAFAQTEYCEARQPIA